MRTMTWTPRSAARSSMRWRDLTRLGSLWVKESSKTIGRLLILDVANKAQAEAFWSGEPFNRAGLYDWTIERWRFGHV